MSLMNITSSNNISVFDYLIKKLESRIKNMHKTKIAINNIVDLNELRENKVHMMKHFSEIEDEINQSIHSMKALLTQNADVCEHAEICLKKARAHELKLITETKKNMELQQINEELTKEIFSLKNIIEEKNSLGLFLNEKILFYEAKIDEKDKEIAEMKKEHERNNESIKRLVEDIEILKIELDAQNFNNEEIKKDEKEIDIDNLRGIISDRENKKKLINEKIKDHFKSNKNTKKPKGNQNNLNDDFNQNQIPLQMKKESNFKNYYDSEDLKKSCDSKVSRVSKHDLISDLIIRITSSPENIDYLNKKFGNDFMNKIFNSDTEEGFLRELEKTLEEKNMTNRTASFQSSLIKKNDENIYKNKNNQSRNNKNFQRGHQSSDRNSSNDTNSNFNYLSFRNNENDKLNNIKTIIKNKISEKETFKNKLSSFDDNKYKEFNQSINDILPGKNYAKNILCKSIGDRFKTNDNKDFEKNLRTYDSNSNNKNGSSSRSFTKSSEKKKFNNFTTVYTRTFEEHLKTNKIQTINKNTMKKPTNKNPINPNDYLFKESYNHDISFSNNYPKSDDVKYEDIKEIKRNSKENNELNYQSKKDNIMINDNYDYPYTSNDEKNQEQLNQEINDIIDNNFGNKGENKKTEEKFGYINTNNSQRENDKNKKSYNFESDRVSLDKNTEGVNNINIADQDEYVEM